MKVYLAGAIRDGRQDDISWREQVIGALHSTFKATILNPLGGKTYNSDTNEWDMSGVRPGASVIVPHDFWMVERADVIIFNLTALAEGYASIGTLVEFGHATALHPRPLIYTILDPNVAVGIGNTKLYSVHPFISINSAVVFPSVNDCVEFLYRHADVLNGFAPSFAGTRCSEPSVA